MTKTSDLFSLLHVSRVSFHVISFSSVWACLPFP